MQEIFLLLLLGLPAICFSTCVVIVRDGEQIIAGADSRHFRTNRPGKDPYSIIIDDYCKIRKSGKFHYALIGFDDSLQKHRAIQACEKANNISHIKEDFPHYLCHDYNRSLEEMRQYDQATYLKILKAEIGIVSFFSYESYTPQLLTFYFKAMNAPDDSVNVGFRVEGNANVSVLGYKKALYNMPDEEYNSINSLIDTDPAQFVRSALQYEIDHHPDILGGPLHILRIDKNGVEWIAGHGNC